MALTFREFTKRIFIFVNFIAVCVFLLACLAVKADPVKFWYVALLGVGFVFLTILVVCFFFFWLFLSSRWAFLSLAAMLAGWAQISALLALHPFSNFTQQKAPGSFRVLTWNVSRWDEMNKRQRTGGSYRMKMFDFIKNQDADVLCIQEFLESRMSSIFDYNIPYIKKHLNYPYHIFAVDYETPHGAYEHGVALFSRYPIVDTFHLKYTAGDILKGGESLIGATINVNGRKVNIFTTHLQSFLFNNTDYRGLDNIKKVDDKDSMLVAGKGIIAKFRRSYSVRSRQARIVRSLLDSSAYPEIICGDFNDVPNSYTYHTIKGDRQDAFTAYGFGLGRTFVSISPTLRIDYILASKKFDILQYKKTTLPFSDHYPLIADFRLTGTDTAYRE